MLRAFGDIRMDTVDRLAGATESGVITPAFAEKDEQGP